MRDLSSKLQLYDDEFEIRGRRKKKAKTKSDYDVVYYFSVLLISDTTVLLHILHVELVLLVVYEYRYGRLR